MWDASHVLKTIFHIDRRAEIESGTIRHKFDQTGVGAYARRGIEKIKHISDAVNDLRASALKRNECYWTIRRCFCKGRIVGLQRSEYLIRGDV